MTLACPTITAPDGSVWFAGAALSLQDGSILSARRRQDWEATSAVPWLTGACLLASAELWHAVGGFEPTYFLYWEDVDLSRRWVLAGGSLSVCADARATHLVGATQGASPGKSLTYVRYSCRNRLRFAARHCTPSQRWAWLRRSPSYARVMVARRHAPGWSGCLRSWAAALTGSVAGATHLVTVSGARTGRATA